MVCKPVGHPFPGRPNMGQGGSMWDEPIRDKLTCITNCSNMFESRRDHKLRTLFFNYVENFH